MRPGHIVPLLLLLPPLLPGSAAQPPAVSIDWPYSNDVLAGLVNVTGAASGGALGVEVRVDEGPWERAHGSSSWWLEWNTTNSADGAHTLQARALYGSGYSGTASVSVAVNNTPPSALELTLALSPERVDTNESFVASGSARFDTGVRVGGGEVELSLGAAACSTYTDRRGYYSLSMRAPDAPGRVVVRARMTSGGLTGSAQEELEVSMPNPPDLSIVPGDILFSPPQPCGGQEVSISAIVRNLGAGSASVRVEFSSPSHVSESARISVTGSWNATVVWSLPSGTHEITVRLLDITPYDSNSSNNEASTALKVFARPDLAVEALMFSNSRPFNGTVISIQARVRNTGERQARGTVSFYDGHPPSAPLISSVVIDVPANSTRLAVVSWEAALGEHEIHALVHDVDPEEATEDNNGLSKGLEVWPRPAPRPEEPAPGPGALAALLALGAALLGRWRR
ncbi:MAG: hypothetical protein ACUVV6_05125 [Thermoplasmatota archaeon]